MSLANSLGNNGAAAADNINTDRGEGLRLNGPGGGGYSGAEDKDSMHPYALGEQDQEEEEHMLTLDDDDDLLLDPHPYGAHQEVVVRPTEFLLLDFSTVIGIDATSARSCFLMLVQLMRAAGVKVRLFFMIPFFIFPFFLSL